MTEGAITEAAASPQAPRLAPGLVRLWIGVLLAPVSWVADFIIRYFAVRYASIHDQHWPFVLSTAGGLILLAVGATLCWRARRDAGDAGTRRTLAAWGLGLALFFFLLILGEAFPNLILSPAEIA